MPAPNVKHTILVQRIFGPIDRQLDPDRFIVFITVFGRDCYVHSAPSLIVTVVPPANRRRDREELKADYTSMGVPEFWFVWLEKRRVEVYRSGQDPYVATEGTLTPQSLQGVRVPISEIWPS